MSFEIPMDDFDALCKIFENLDPESYNEIINRKSANVIKALSEITDNGHDGVSIYADFIMCAVAADGKLTEEEFLLLKPSLDLFLEADLTFEDVESIFYDAGYDQPKDYKKSMDMMVDILGMVSPELKNEIILLCMMVCAVDGEVSDSEKDWIRQLIE